mgnify:CR=1 FL=1
MIAEECVSHFSCFAPTFKYSGFERTVRWQYRGTEAKRRVGGPKLNKEGSATTSRNGLRGRHRAGERVHGGDAGAYRWTQTPSEVDVCVPVPEDTRVVRFRRLLLKMRTTKERKW